MPALAFVFALLWSSCVAHTSLRTSLHADPEPPDEEEGPLPGAPPTPEGEAPDLADDGAFDSKEDACASCKFTATGSCAMYKTCVCYATNAHFGIANLPEPSDTNNWHWACGNGAGEKYKLCFKVEGSHMDNFGDEIDPTKPKCPL
eukprot:gnl/MRDRNA2_/MRDRNA2_34831_c0_seq1.p1 gnl/MRDRNA2_/MRDRNA2_34831_c0~~gnl/MRDRNA2_/MRDRNA2_34831_c0_seq1.p1  ORF type:complete len:146 (-),score=30.16 gnl/MRDRNA2_/MRDRNA2_34831_c0_seq1:38-475(-)